ncbi:MAG: hypothetical protein KGJ13_05670 [Patescibacteria group bacterium]|nr:hypothetical protein [Patescibacteria group bacterium]
MSYGLNPLANNVNLAGNIPPSTMDGLDAKTMSIIQQAMAQNPGLTLKSFWGFRGYDTARCAAGTAFNASEFELFATPVGQQTTEMNGTTQYTKSLIDTNMRTARQLPQGQLAWITSIQARIVVTGQLDDTTQTGANLGLANSPGIGSATVAADDVIGVNLAQAAMESIYMKFQYNQTSFEEGPLYLFPTRYVLSGFSGPAAYVPGTAGTTIMQNETLVNNGIGIVFTLPIVRQIDSLYQFGVTLQALNTFTPTRNFRIQIILEGLGAKAVTG